jgi:hypothetical protein
MHQEDSVLPGAVTRRGLFVPALVCAVISVVLTRNGFMSFFFLVPLGYAAAVYNPAAAWQAFVIAAILNGVLSVGFSLYYRAGMVGAGMDVLHYTVMTLGFTWIMTGGNNGTILRVRTMYRFVAASVAGALTFLLVGHGVGNNAGFAEFIRSQAEAFSSLYMDAAGVDAARRPFLERALTPEKVVEAITAVALRGGALTAALVVFYVNRQAAWSLAWMIRRRRSAQSLRAFHVPSGAIWVLSLSLAGVLLFRIIKVEFPEIIAWNILVLCAILFLAQGGGIALFTLANRPMPPMLRLVCNILCIVVIFSPGINTAVLGLLILLGIAENWLPLRAPKTDGPASTPGL